MRLAELYNISAESWDVIKFSSLKKGDIFRLTDINVFSGIENKNVYIAKTDSYVDTTYKLYMVEVGKIS